MKKTVSGVLLALTAAFALVACGKKSKKRNGKENVINFYVWNDEFQSRLNAYYPEVDKTNGSTTTLKNGVIIQWTQATNEGSVYQDTLDTALQNNMVDMFCFEADYAAKYVKSEYVVNMADLGLTDAMKGQYKYTQDIVTNDKNQIVGSSWQGTPGVIVYNKGVAKQIWGNDVAESRTEMDKLLSADFATFKTAAAKVAADGKGKGVVPDGEGTKAVDLTMMIGPACWYRTYGNNLKAKMWDGKKITVDANLFQWAKDSKEFTDNGYFRGVASDYGLWQGEWGAEQGRDNALCIFSCPWFTDFCLTGYRPIYEKDKDGNPDKSKPITYGGKAHGDANLGVVKGYSSWFWGGTWLTATTFSQQEDSIGTAGKSSVTDIIKQMTTNTDILKKIAKEKGDFTNDKTAMEAAAKDDDYKNAYFGGQNVFEIYAESVKNADLSKASDYDQQITEEFQSAFTGYFQKTRTAAQAWDEFVKQLSTKTSIASKNIVKASDAPELA